MYKAKVECLKKLAAQCGMSLDNYIKHAMGAAGPNFARWFFDDPGAVLDDVNKKRILEIING